MKKKRDNYQPFGLIEEQAKLRQFKILITIWQTWKRNIRPQTYDGNKITKWKLEFRQNHRRCKQFWGNIHRVKKLAHGDKQQIHEERIEEPIKLVKMHTGNRDLPSALKAFRKFTRKPYSPIIEL